MTEHLPGSDRLKSVLTSASVRLISDEAAIIIFGAGRGGLAMLKVLSHYDWVNIHTIVDINANAPAFELADEMGVPTTTDPDIALESFQGNIIIDVTGNTHMAETLKAVAHEGELELISGNSAKLMFDLVDGQLHSRDTIQIQNTKLSMLDSMLEITRLLENNPTLSEVANKSFKDLHGQVEAVKGLAVIFDYNGAGELVGAIGVDKPFCNASTCDELQAACSKLDKKQPFHFLPQPIVLNCSISPISFNSILSLWQQDRLAGALLFDIQGGLSHEIQTALNIASIHLNMTVRTLYQQQKLEKMASLDGLTGVFNRRHFDQRFKEEISRVRRSNRGTLTCAFVDIDDFKLVNDLHGHPVGDQVLVQVADCVSDCIRDYDTCARYGGDEFVILLPSETHESHAYLERIGNRILQQVAEIKLADIADCPISVSIGMATLPSGNLDEKKLLAQADYALYQAKKTGKGCLCFYSDSISHNL
jgi:diguanylate cyclase (GGDEF)-like protein